MARVSNMKIGTEFQIDGRRCRRARKGEDKLGPYNAVWLDGGDEIPVFVDPSAKVEVIS